MRRIACVVLVCVVTLVVCGWVEAQSRVKVYADVDRPYVLAGSGQRVVVKVGLSGLEWDTRVKRQPLNVAIALDRSGSMGSGNKMENAKRGAIEVVERLSRDDIVSLVVYSSGPRVIIPAQRVKDKDALIEMISSIFSGGSTALYAGVTVGASEIRKHMSWKYDNRIVLLSDGLANVGPQSTEELAYLGRSLGSEGITVTTIGVGVDYNEDLMTALADRSGGNAYFASTSGELPRIFAEEIGEAMTLAAHDVRVRVYCRDRVRPISIIGREGDIHDQTMSVTIGKLYGKSDKYALFEVEVPKEASGRGLEIAEIFLEYTDPATNERRTDRQKVSIVYSEDSKTVDENENKTIIKEAALTQASEAKCEAVRLADRGDAKAAAGVIAASALALEKVAAECDNDKDLLEEAENCDAISEDISVNSGLTKYQRKKVVNEAYTQTTQQGYTSDEKDEKKE